MLLLFFFFKQKTAYEMRISDWSSDVCSSDLQQVLGWLSQLALWGSLASILVGAAVYGLAQNAGNYNGAFRGKQLAVAGAIGACLTGLAPTALNLLFDAAASCWNDFPRRSASADSPPSSLSGSSPASRPEAPLPLRPEPNTPPPQPRVPPQSHH